jgi:hypothetical protein
MVRWTSVERKIEPPPPVRPSKVRTIVIDPESRSIDEMEMQATVPALEALLRAPPLCAFGSAAAISTGTGLQPQQPCCGGRKISFSRDGS